MTKEELQNYFRVYLDQIPLLRVSKAYWALLHYIIIFPAICAGLESSSGESSGRAYKSWAKKYLATPNFTEKDWYKVRCKLLHEGKTEHFSFSQPNTAGQTFHKNQHSDSSFNLDIDKLTQEVLSGLDSWFDDIVSDPNTLEAKNVSKNIVALAQPKDANSPFGRDITGITAQVSASPKRL